MFRVSRPLCIIELKGDVLHSMLAHRQTERNASEGGGVLLGLRRGPHFQVTAITTPKSEDYRSRAEFRRVALPHQPEARRIWRNSGKLYGYLGEWHTHPEPEPRPSFIDRAGWRMRYLEKRQSLVHIIVGTEEVRAWYCDANGLIHETTNERWIEEVDTGSREL